MKKSLLIITLIMMLLTSVANAEKIKFKDSQFNYKNFDTVQLTEITILNVDNKDFITDKGSEMKINLLLRQAFNNRQITLKGTEKTTQDANQSMLKPIPMIAVKVYCLGYDKIFHGPWDEVVTRTSTISHVDRHGHYDYIYIPYTEVVHHPAGYYYNAEADLEFDVIDSRTNKTIYTVRDSRGRGGETDTSGMLKRICNDFAEDITKN
jgi:hypothetical protein